LNVLGGESSFNRAITEKGTNQEGDIRPRPPMSLNHRSATLAAGQLSEFMVFLVRTGRFADWENSCPLTYTSPNAPSKAEFLRTWILAILHGCQRYAHVSALHAGSLEPMPFRHGRLVGDDALRRGLASIATDGGGAWLRQHLMVSTRSLMRNSWMLNVDIMRKPVFRVQDSRSHGPADHRPRCRTHCYQTYFMAGTNLALGGEVLPASGHDASTTTPELIRILDQISEHERPRLIQGFCEPVWDTLLAALEQRHQPYLFGLNLGTGTALRMQRAVADSAWVVFAKGCQGSEMDLTLPGWTRPRRAMLLRHAGDGEMRPDQRGNVVVLTTNLESELPTLEKMYRNAGNDYQEIKDIWRWGGFVTEDPARCQVAMLGVALIYNWWNVFASSIGMPCSEV